MMTDPIADMLTRIRNAYLAHKQETQVTYSKLKKTLADILVREGYLAGVEERRDGNPFLILNLKYKNGQPAISNILRVSRPSYRLYVRKGNIKEVLNGYGLSIISTPKGMLTNAEARVAGVGGEVICEVY